MIAAVLQGPKNIEVKQCEKPIPKPHEVLIRLHSIGICGSDVHLYLGDRLLPEPNIIGHEGIGIIEQIGAQVTNFFEMNLTFEGFHYFKFLLFTFKA